MAGTAGMREQPGPPTTGSTRRRPPWLVIGTLVVVAVAGVGAAIASVLLGPYVRDRVTAEARQRGVELVFGGVRFWWWSASLEAVRFRLIGVPGLEGTATTIDVALSSWEPTQIEGSGVRLTGVGSALDLALATSEWTKAHPQAFHVPVSAHDVGASLRSSASEAPWLTIDGGALAESASGTTFSAAHAVVSGVDVGSVGASWTADVASITLSFGAADPKTAPLSVVVHHAATPPTATVTLAAVELSRLTGPLGVPLATPGVTASGHANLTFVAASGTADELLEYSRAVGALAAGSVTGQLDAQLDGWVPPHPVELDGFLFGSTTTFTSNLYVDAARTTVKLSGSRVRAGAFDLAGGGRIDRKEGFATILMSFAGNLPCSAVAQSAAAAHVGSFLSEIVGSAARRVVDGSVAVKVRIAADTRDLAGASVEPTVGVGCGLRPLRSVDPKILERIPGALQDFAKALPALPDFDFR